MTIYFLPTFWRAYALVFPLLGLLFGGTFVYVGVTTAGASPELKLFMFAAALSFLLLASAIGLAVLRIRLELSETGLAYHTLGYSVVSTWENVEAIGMHRGSSGLLLREPGLSIIPLLRPLLPPFLTERDHHFVPLSYFVRDWQAHALGQQVRQHVTLTAWPQDGLEAGAI